MRETDEQGGISTSSWKNSSWVGRHGFVFPRGNPWHRRRIMHTDNCIEALNSRLRRAMPIRGHSPVTMPLRSSYIWFSIKPRRTENARRAKGSRRKPLSLLFSARGFSANEGMRLEHETSDSPDVRGVLDPWMFPLQAKNAIEHSCNEENEKSRRLGTFPGSTIGSRPLLSFDTSRATTLVKRNKSKCCVRDLLAEIAVTASAPGFDMNTERSVTCPG